MNEESNFEFRKANEIKLTLKSHPIFGEEDDIHKYKNVAIRLSHAFVKLDLPVTVALTGDFGSGKTSIIYMALSSTGYEKKDIKEIHQRGGGFKILKSTKNKIKPVNIGLIYFDAKLWEDYSDLFSALMLLIMEEFKKHLNLKSFKSFKRSIVKIITSSTIQIMANKIGITDIDKLKKKIKSKTDLLISDAKERLELRKEIKNIFKEIDTIIKKEDTGNKNVRILLILDNLDRISPEKAINLLTSIYQYIPHDMEIFVLACFNRALIDQEIVRKFGISDTTSFLSKYIDFFWAMPLPKREGYLKIIKKYLEKAPDSCLEGLKIDYIFAGMLHKAGVTNIRMLEMILKRFILNLNFHVESPIKLPHRKTDDYLKHPYLFSLNLDNKQYFRDGKVSDSIRDIFNSNGQTLSTEAILSKIDGKHWKIEDSPREYLIKDTKTQRECLIKDTKIQLKVFGVFNKLEFDLIKVIGQFYKVLIYLKWEWLYDAFYKVGQSGGSIYKKVSEIIRKERKEELKTERKVNIETIISEIKPDTVRKKIHEDPNLESFLSSYLYLTSWANPGDSLIKSFEGEYDISEEIIKRTAEELREGTESFKF